MTVRELLSRIGSDELTEWQAYALIEPFGELRGDLRAGIVAATVANSAMGKRGQPLQARDFMPLMDREEEQPILLDDPEQQARLLKEKLFGHRS